MDDLACSVRFGFQVPCPDEHGPDYYDYVVAVEGTIIVHAEPPGDEAGERDLVDTEAGTVSALAIQTTRASNDGMSLLDICDAHSGDLEGLFATLFDTKSEEPREELGIEPLWEGLLYLDEIEVVPEYRDWGVAVRALEAMIQTFCPNGIIAAYPAGMGLTDAEWKELDFVKIAGSEVIFRDSASLSPYRPSSGGGEEE